jgi:hypothetical protein
MATVFVLTSYWKINWSEIKKALLWNSPYVYTKHACLHNALLDYILRKSKAVPLHALEALGVRGGIAPTHSRPRHEMGVGSQRHAPAALYSRGKDPRYPLYRRLGGPQSRSGHRGYRKNPLPLPGIESRSPGRPARSQTLYWLSYSAPSTSYELQFILEYMSANSPFGDRRIRTVST